MESRQAGWGEVAAALVKLLFTLAWIIAKFSVVIVVGAAAGWNMAGRGQRQSTYRRGSGSE